MSVSFMLIHRGLFLMCPNGCGMRSWWIVARLPVRMDRGIW